MTSGTATQRGCPGLVLALLLAGHASWHSGAAAELLHFVSSQPQRSLQATTEQPRCLWNADTGLCSLNTAYYTTLPGAPSTDSAKATAMSAARQYRCRMYADQPTCNTAGGCQWGAPFGLSGCIPHMDSMIDLMRGLVFCPGSRLDAAMRCTVRRNKGLCGSDPSCLWVDPKGTVKNDPINALLGYVSYIAALTGGYMSTLFTDDAETCLPKWVTDPTVVSNLAQALRSAEETSTYGTYGAMWFVPQVVGSCTSIDGFRKSVASCYGQSSEYVCSPIKLCTWSGSQLRYNIVDPPTAPQGTAETKSIGYLAGCSPSLSAVNEVIFDRADPWVAAGSQQRGQCANAYDENECSSFGKMQVDAAKLQSWLGLRTSYQLAASVPAPGASGGKTNPTPSSVPLVVKKPAASPVKKPSPKKHPSPAKKDPAHKMR